MRGKFTVESKMFAFHFTTGRNHFCVLTSFDKRSLFEGVLIISGRKFSAPDTKIIKWLAEFSMKINSVICLARAVPPTAASRRAFDETFNGVIICPFH